MTHMKLLIWPVAGRLSARKHKKQIFLSVDIPPSFMDLGQGPRTVFEAEKSVNEVIKQLEDSAFA